MAAGYAGAKTTADGRYRALLDASIAIAEQPTVNAVLHSLRGVLSSTCKLHGAHLWVLSGKKDELQVIEFDREADAPPIPTGTTISSIGALALVLQEQKPLFLPDVAVEMFKHPALAPFAPESVGRSTWLFPVSTAHNRYGVLVVTKEQGDEFVAEDVDLLRSLASHVAVALETALVTDRAERYQRELAKERDRLRLLLQINNAIVSQLEIGDVFRASSTAIRDYFGNDFTGVWLIDRESKQMERALLDFPTGKGVLADLTPKHLADEDFKKFRARQPEFWSDAEIEKLPPPIAENLKAESIRSIAITPLVTAGGPLGLLAMGCRKPNAFRQEDLELLSQIGAQSALALENAVAYGRLSASHAHLEEQRLYLESEIRAEYSFDEIVGKSAAIRKVLDQVSIVAPTASTVLLRGETGTGKELIARAIHNRSPRRDRTFVRLNCAAIPSGLVESELFGHEKGAFTGALMQKRGRFELADRGTLFLDEIGDISLELQPKLLRAIQEQEFERLGSTKTIRVDVRLIAATHRDLPAMIRNNQFREDLFYRLNVFPIDIPPLRERREDIPLLVHYFVSRLSRRMQKRITSIGKEAINALVNAEWPGNIRELENFIERCVILTQGDALQIPQAELNKAPSRKAIGGASTFEEAERQAIIEALKNSSGRIAGRDGAAERLGLKRTTLQYKIQRLSITPADYSR